MAIAFFGLGPVELLILSAGGVCCLVTTIALVVGVNFVVRTATKPPKSPD